MLKITVKCVLTLDHFEIDKIKYLLILRYLPLTLLTHRGDYLSVTGDKPNNVARRKQSLV